MKNKIRVAIIGCGQISDAHIGEIKLLPEARLVAVCDMHEALAEDTAERHDIKAYYTDYQTMLDKENPNVVHVTTPPQTHLEIGTYALDRGCNIYVEKPFCTSREETAQLIENARRKNLMVCAGYSQTMDLSTLKFRAFLETGKLGEIVHVESYYGDCLEGSFSKVFLRTGNHWVHRLPGKLIQNVITHALYNIAPLLPSEVERVTCFADDRSKNGKLQDELRVLLQSGNVTGYITFTSVVKPITQTMRVYGTKAIAEIDFTNHILSIKESSDLPGTLARISNGIVPGLRLISAGLRNAKNTITGKDRFFAGMGGLFRRFYSSIIEKSQVPPVPYQDIIRVADLMDKIAQCMQKEENR